MDPSLPCPNCGHSITEENFQNIFNDMPTLRREIQRNQGNALAISSGGNCYANFRIHRCYSSNLYRWFLAIYRKSTDRFRLPSVCLSDLCSL